MVLQANRINPIWGWAAAGSEVSVHWQGRTVTTRADDSNRWRTELAAVPPGGPHVLTVSSENDILTLRDVLAGEVWLCSGQSNMEWSVAQANRATEEIAAADFPEIRFLKIPRRARTKAQEDTATCWQVCSPKTVSDFSAVGYFFGREINQTRKVPIGLINSSWGGTLAEAWTEWSFLENEPAFASFVQPYLKSLVNCSDEENQKRQELLEHWRKVERFRDPGNRGYFLGWADPAIDETDWKNYQVPGLWQQKGMNHNGAVWFRKVVTVPNEWAGRDLILSLGALDDFDETYLNGVLVGSTDNQIPNAWMTPRNYPIPAKLVQAGQSNTLTVRIFDEFGQGGFGGGAVLALHPADAKPETGVRLEGEWKSRVEYAFDSTVPPRIQALLDQKGPFFENAPANLYNGMIAPLAPYGLRGALWYQGESNAERPEQYQKLILRLIESWRTSFQNPELAFFFVLLANWQSRQTEPVQPGWGDIREAQLEALKLPLTGFASAIDVGDANDIHPRNKQAVGHRLALSARAILYGEKIVHEGPTFEKAELEKGRLRIHFSSAVGLKTRDGEPLLGFAVKGKRGEWQWADAIIEGESVLLSSVKVPQIEHVRYAWATNPVGNLTNAAGLPAVPFRTDR